jgi:uncharacterized protein (DUF58 family)
MTPRNRTRLLWLLTALVSLHTLTVTIVFAATGTFPNALMTLTMLVYGAMLVAALALLAFSRPRRLHRIEPPQRPVEQEMLVEPLATMPGPEAEGTGA